MKGTWVNGSVLERLALHWGGPRRTPDEPVDVFGELRRARKILLIPNDRVGGLFLGSGIYSSVRLHYPRAHVVLLTDERLGTLARRIRFVDEALTTGARTRVWQPGFRQLVARLRERAFDLAICLGSDCSFRLAQLCALSQARLRVGFRRPGQQLYNLEIVRRDELQYEPEQYMSLMRILGLDRGGEVHWAVGGRSGGQLRQRYLDGEFATGTVVAIDLSGGDGRGLSGRQLDDVVGRVIERGFRAVLFFSLAERRRVDYLKNTYGNRVLPFAQDDLCGVAALLEGCRALIACNTDVLHLAISLKLPSVGIFDEDARRWISSRNDRVLVVQVRDVRAVSITRVAQALERVLARSAADAALGSHP